MISEQQLERWGQAPSPTEMEKIKKTRELIEEKIKANFPVAELKAKYHMASLQVPNIYLQGSYANSTNIRFDSDVDIVAQLDDVFWSDKTQLSEFERQQYDLTYPKSEYNFLAFKNDVYLALQKSFGYNATIANKCIKIQENTNRVNADVVPCFQYRVYKKFISFENQEFVEGMKFINTGSNAEIVNFPKKHIENCESKNVDTDGNFKSVVRIFKNIKRELVESGVLNEKVAPSYFIENLLYNCSSPCFDGNFSKCMISTLQFIFDAMQTGRMTGFVCANEQDSLISVKTWNLLDAQNFIIAAGNYYLNTNK